MELILVLILVLANGFFALSEMAVMTSRKSRLRQMARTSKRAQKAIELSEHPDKFLSSVQVWITLLGLLTGYFGAETFAVRMQDPLSGLPLIGEYADNIAYVISFGLILFLSVVLGELLPKRLATLNPERTATLVALPMHTLALVARPVVALLAGSTRGLLKLLGLANTSADKVSEEEIRLLVAESHEQGVIDADERNMLNRVLRLGDRTAASLMTPRPRITWLDAAASLEDNLNKMRETPFSRYPVYRNSEDEVIGVLEVKTLAGRLDQARNATDLFSDLRPALFVSESTASLKLLEIFREEQQTMALVVDEYGDIIGMVTTNDLLGAVIGRIQAAEDDIAGPQIIQRDDGSWLIDGRLSTEDLRELLGVGVLPGEEDSDFHTAAGMVIAQFGRIPHVGEIFTWDNWRIEVVDLDGARVDKLLISQTPSPLEAEIS